MKTVTFNGVTYTTADLEKKSGPELVALFNSAASVLDTNLVTRFATKDAAVKRTWKILEEAAPQSKAPKAAKAKKVAKTVSEKAPRAHRGVNLAAGESAPLPCREGTKQSVLVDMLSRPAGATMEDLLDALSGGNKPWTEATVRSGFGWDLKLKGYGVRSKFDEKGNETFHLVVPKGHKIPAHAALKSPPKAHANQQRLGV